MNYSQHVQSKVTSQSEPIPGSNQVQNSAGGYSYPVDDWTRLDRFLCLGAEGGTYYVKEKELTKENAAAVLRCAKLDPARTVNRIVAVSEAGRAPKNDPAVFALALLATQPGPENIPLRKLAFEAMPKVCRIGTHLFQFVAAVDALKPGTAGGKLFRASVNNWYAGKRPDQLTYQLTKYQQRNGWSHRDVMRLGHFHEALKGLPEVYREAYHWVAKGWESVGEEPHPDAALRRIWAMERANRSESLPEILRLIGDHGLTREMVPTKWLNEVSVWDALLKDMPLTAMIRNLGKMTSIGLLSPFSTALKKIAVSLGDVEYLKRSRIHPLSLLVAQKIYTQGKGDKGSLTWSPNAVVTEALNQAFYLAFDAVEPTGKNWFLGLDVSGSMSSAIAGTPLSCAEATAALALVTARTEPNTYLGAFCDVFRDVPFTKSTRLDDALQMTRGMNFGRTDCALPMLEAKKRGIKEVDVFVVLTDCETWCGNVHPSQALRAYRQYSGRPAKSIVVGMTANGFTIADPNDAGSMDVVGFDTAVPAVMADFVRG